MRLGRIGVWSVGLTHGDRAEAREAAAELEELGYGALWLGGVPGDNPQADLAPAAEVLAATRRTVVAVACLSIWTHTPDQLAAAYRALPAADRGRLVTGLAVSHAPFAERYRQPLTAMCRYLDALDAIGTAPPPSARLIGAHRPRMTQLAAARTAGTQPYLVDACYTARARALLGAGPLLAPVQTVVPLTDPVAARAVARTVLAPYLTLPNLNRTWLDSGFTEADLQHGGSDRLVDRLVAWGDTERITAHVTSHLRAGADHVAVHVVTEHPRAFPRAAWHDLASVLPTI
ncbi:TIGR03620 family F420-dependent LLM class oxidoreductase [Streptomyces sp. RY43-2]|uniref:TIGR03620 family F420-dependent LLM class oxidoreductase n=1 Tax=Streptomyces macrolidinus TaxID=2952607 RepID=A0ABT0ZJJ4_9ACTN|nr:TIGR03620 family F420-dependent LLM class oxidoreductase [Streptomyces macrolidinus]MCN9243759.1 TIGR03620 family F420-dependent LLM class oxidoreductase [Streptomyces macrolidinus]